MYCRSTTAPYFDDDFGQIGERAARDKNGKTYYVPADIKYKDWKAQQDVLHGAGFVDLERKKAYNESTDRDQWKNYRNRLGDDIPSLFKDFQTLEYEDAESYNNLVELYRYKGRVPEATKEDYELYKKVKATGIVGTVRVPPYPVDADALDFKDEHGKRHGCTIEDCRKYIKEAKCSIVRKRYNGLRLNIYSPDGAVYLDYEDKRTVYTSFPREEFDSTTGRMMEVFEK